MRKIIAFKTNMGQVARFFNILKSHTPGAKFPSLYFFRIKHLINELIFPPFFRFFQNSFSDKANERARAR